MGTGVGCVCREDVCVAVALGVVRKMWVGVGLSVVFVGDGLALDVVFIRRVVIH